MGSKKETAPPPEPPKPTNSKIYQDDFLTGETYIKGNDTINKSYSTPFQLQQQQLQQSYLPIVQSNILNPDQKTKDSWATIAQATKDNQMKAFNVDYDKAQNDLIQNISSRNLQRSSAVPYMTNELAKTAANQLDTINNNFTANQQNAQNEYLNQQYNAYNMLNGGLANQLQTNQTNLANANTGFNTGNNFNLNNYQNQMNQWALQKALNGNTGNSWLLPTLGTAAGGVLGTILAPGAGTLIGGTLGGQIGGSL